MAITIALIYLAELYLDVQIAQTGNVKLIAQILIFAIGVFWSLALIPTPLKHNLYFALGAIMLLIALYSLATLSQINIPTIRLLAKINVFETMTLVFCGVFFITYGWMAIPSFTDLKTSSS
ncbi:hypothetical protein JXK06_03645 [Patescibacteria group bacterium]|nr:hypothetical protein [Patescibacteria group bacterium]